MKLFPTHPQLPLQSTPASRTSQLSPGTWEEMEIRALSSREAFLVLA